MKQTKQKAPISLLLIIADKGTDEIIQEYFSKKNLRAGLTFMGKGTAESQIADIFGFGLNEKDIIACLIPKAKEDKIIKEVTELIGIEKDAYGLTMLLDLTSATSSILEMFE